MFKKLKDFFGGDSDSGAGGKKAAVRLEYDKTGNPTDNDLHVATAVLLIEMAGQDQDIAREEAEAVCTLMQQQFGISEARIPELVEIAISSRKSKGKINEFVSVVNDRFSEEQRTVVLGMIWKIVLADGKIEQYERNFANQMQQRLKLGDEAAKEARKLAEEGRV